jgi:hypothetical protein
MKSGRDLLQSGPLELSSGLSITLKLHSCLNNVLPKALTAPLLVHEAPGGLVL